MPRRWATGDEVYGNDPGLRGRAANTRLGYVLAVACSHQVTTGARHPSALTRLAAGLPTRAWQRVSAGAGAKGHRYYDWALIALIRTRRRRTRPPLAADPPQPPHR